MAEVKRVIACMNATGVASFETEEDLVGGSAYDAHGKADLRRDHGEGAGRRRRALRRGRRAEMGQGRL